MGWPWTSGSTCRYPGTSANTNRQSYPDRLEDRQTYIQTYRQIHLQTGIQTNEWTYRQTEETQTKKQASRGEETERQPDSKKQTDGHNRYRERNT